MGFSLKNIRSLGAGKLADLVVLSTSLLDTPQDQIKSLKVDMTFIDEKQVQPFSSRFQQKQPKPDKE